MKTSSILLLASLCAAFVACSNEQPAAPAASSTPTPAVDAPVIPETLPSSEFKVDATAALPAGGGCALDGVNGAPAGDSVAVSGEAVLEGWAVASEANGAGDATIVLVGSQDQYAAALDRSLERPDVASALQRDDALRSGFKQRTTLASVSPGEYAIHVRIGAVECDTGRKLVVEG